ncbi:UNVERIFIED_CONTAM: hypothetical protein FKN15_022680 [Acipenser sinensis]
MRPAKLSVSLQACRSDAAAARSTGPVSRYNRRPLPQYEARIAESWSQRCLQNPWLFNGSKFRILTLLESNMN